jgi:hypothetical protein
MHMLFPSTSVILLTRSLECGYVGPWLWFGLFFEEDPCLPFFGVVMSFENSLSALLLVLNIASSASSMVTSKLREGSSSVTMSPLLLTKVAKEAPIVGNPGQLMGAQ